MECSNCHIATIPLEKGYGPRYPVQVYICTGCSAAMRCGCDGCEALIALAGWPDSALYPFARLR